ncbi:MAG TPA: hypothetical protein VFJ15_07335, partial [Oleiagrimonas sp.]|nr:hypothetical protein [Oleiagrimonas sp.]
ELAALPILIGARACQSILMATRAQREQPDNTYVQVSQQGMRHLLQTLSAITPGALVAPFQETVHD